MKFSKRNGLTLRKTERGETLYATVTVRDEYLIHILQVLSERSGKSATKILGQFIQDAFDAGLTPCL